MAERGTVAQKGARGKVDSESRTLLPDPYSVFPNLVEVVRFRTPVLWPRSGEWDEGDIHSHFVIRSGSQTFLYFNGLPQDGPDQGIGLAVSDDGIHFRRYSEKPIIPVGKRGEWDSGHLWKMDVIRVSPKDWRMWYGGFEEGHKWNQGRVGYATSEDGIHWEKHPGNPVLEPGDEAWEKDCVADLRVVYDQYNQEYRGLYYGAPVTVRPASIGYATSTDGVRWKKYAHNPVMTPIGGGQEGDLLSPKHFMRIGDVYVNFYEALDGGRAFHTGNAVAYSYDCIHWVRDPRNPFQRDCPGELPVDPSLVLEDGWFRNYYGITKPGGQGGVGLSYHVTGASRKISFPVLSADRLGPDSSSRYEEALPVDLGRAQSVAFTVTATFSRLATKGLKVHILASVDGRSFDTVDYALTELAPEPGKRAQKTQSVAPHVPFLGVVVENLDSDGAVEEILVQATVQAP